MSRTKLLCDKDQNERSSNRINEKNSTTTTMKISISSTFLFRLFCLSPAPAVSRLLQRKYPTEVSRLPSNGRVDQQPSFSKEPYLQGYNEAERLWRTGMSDGTYDCASITETFWVHVQKRVLTSCATAWPTDVKESGFESCKMGAETFTKEAMDQCFDKTDCVEAGAIATRMVAGRVCGVREAGVESAPYMPTKCAAMAMESCSTNAADMVKTAMNDGGRCSEVASVRSVSFEDMCKKAVYIMEEKSKLTYGGA